jgi:hypothetical protein
VGSASLSFHRLSWLHEVRAEVVTRHREVRTEVVMRHHGRHGDLVGLGYYPEAER